MTKGGSGKSKTLGRLIFGEKRKQHASPARHRSSTRNGGSTADLSISNVASPSATTTGVSTNKNPINIHDWAAWRTQLNEQMSATMSEGRVDFKQMRQFLQSNPFYQQHCRDPLSGKYNGVQLLFSIPHARIKPEYFDGLREGITKNNNNSELPETVTYEQKKVRSNSDDRTTTSVNSISAVQPMVVDKTLSQLFPKGLIGHTGGFLQTNEQMIAADGIRPRRTTRSSFIASDRIHATLQKAVKDGNVLEKIKAFEMQAAAAAQAESALKLTNINNRMQSAAHRTLSPATIHPIQNTISPISIQQQSILSARGRHVHPVQQRRDGTHSINTGHESRSRKGAHVLEPAHGDVILKRRTPSQKVIHDEDYSITAISSMALTASHGHHRNHHHHHHHHRTSTSRSRHRQEMTYDKRSSSKTEHNSHKHQQKQKGTTTPSTKSSTRRRWLKGRKETPTETLTQDDKQEISITKSTKSHKKKKNNKQQASTPVNKENPSIDNNRVYGVPNPNVNEQNESNHEQIPDDNTNTYISPKEEEEEEEDRSPNKECDTVKPTAVQRRPNKKHHQIKLSSTDGEILSKVDENTRFSRPTDDHAHHSEINDDDDDDESEDDVFIEDTPTKPTPNIKRHQSVLNVPNKESRRVQQQIITPIRRHASQCSADECTSERRFQHLRENPPKKPQLPITLITRKNKTNQDEQIVYEAPHSDQPLAPVCNTHTLKKKRQFHTINTIGSSTNNGQSNSTNNKQISKQILHAIMNSMNNNQEQATIVPAQATINDDFFENGPLTNPEEIISNITPSI